MSQLSHYSRKSMSCHSGSQFRSTIKKNIQSIGYHNEVNDFSSTLNQLEQELNSIQLLEAGPKQSNFLRPRGGKPLDELEQQLDSLMERKQMTLERERPKGIGMDWMTLERGKGIGMDSEKENLRSEESFYQISQPVQDKFQFSLYQQEEQACRKKVEEDYYTFSFKGKKYNDGDRLLQTGKFEQEMSGKKSVEPKQRQFALRRFRENELPDAEDLKQLTGLLIDTPDEQFDSLPYQNLEELRRLSSIILFRVRNRQQDLRV